MPKADEKSLTMAALSAALADPTPRPLVGTKAKPGVFIGGTAAIKASAQRAVEQGWLAATGQFEGQGRTRKPLYRITPQGAAYALEHGPAPELLRDMLTALDGQSRRLERLQSDLAAAAELTRAQAQAVRELLARHKPPNLADVALAPAAASSAGWGSRALQYLAEHRRRNPYGRCPLPELFQHTAQGMSIGQFHDGVRQLASQGKISLHPFTGAPYQLRDEQYALVVGQEIKFYVELVAS